MGHISKKLLVVLSGAGISAESGIPTFRDAGGLWEGHSIYEVATPEAFHKDPAKVLDFYNWRRKKALEVLPNPGHFAIAELEEDFEVVVITQNVDNLHEKAGSSNVIHLHGNLFEAKSSMDESLVYPIEGWQLNMGETCEKGSQLRPNIVWFGEMVPMIEPAAEWVSKADIFVVVGTSLQVYPAAGLLDFARPEIPKYLVDPKAHEISRNNFEVIAELAGIGMPILQQKLKAGG
ncbi:NAD-dependent deacylase [Fulvivirgaceae bacterium LMO-SS25]